MIGTVGRLQAYPGGVNVIPGRVELSLDLRAEFDDERDSALDEIWATAGELCARRGLTLETTEIYRADAGAVRPAADGGDRRRHPRDRR